MTTTSMHYRKTRKTPKGVLFKAGKSTVHGDLRVVEIFIGKVRTKDNTIVYPVKLSFVEYDQNDRKFKRVFSDVPEWYHPAEIHAFIEELKTLESQKIPERVQTLL